MPVMVSLGKAQPRHIEHRFAKNNSGLRHDYLQPDVEARRKASIKRTVRRIENFMTDFTRDNGL